MLGLKSRSFLLFWLCVVHRIASKEGSIMLMSRVSWYMELKRWVMKADDLRSLERTERIMPVKPYVWRCCWITESAVRIYTTLLVLSVVHMWWGVERLPWFRHIKRNKCGWLSVCLQRVSWWRGREVIDGVGRHWNSVLGMTMKLLGSHGEWAVHF